MKERHPFAPDLGLAYCRCVRLNPSAFFFLCLQFTSAACESTSPSRLARKPTDQGSKVTIETLALEKKVIPLRYRIGDFRVSDVKLPDLLVTNHRGEPVRIEKIVVQGMTGQVEVVSLSISRDHLDDAIREGRALVEAVRKGPVYADARGIVFGTLRPTAEVVDGRELAPGTSVAILLSPLVHLIQSGPTYLDEVMLTAITSDGAVERRIPLVAADVKGTYEFPLAGTDLVATNLGTNPAAHRSCQSQEFAADILAVQESRGGRTSHVGDGRKLDDYFVFGRPVKAMEDGVVIGAVGNTGNSTEPHLHVQLMDSPDLVKANGLPLRFATIPVSAMGDDVGEASSLFHVDSMVLPPQ